MLISDIHLRDYHRYNKFPHQRLLSFITLAKDIVEIGRSNNIDKLLIGGDIVDKNTLSPLELHILFKMFTILASQFRIYSIIGNHDAKSKTSIDREDTVITLLEEIPGISFHHQEILEFGGKKIAFENWMPEYDLSWIKEPVDVYMSHSTIDYDNTGLYGMDTSVFDGKFTLGVFGDIHVTSQLGNLLSIGNTKQESLSDKYQGGVMILDLDDLSFDRIPIDPTHKTYLHMKSTDDEDDDGWEDFDGDSMVYKIYKPAKSQSKSFDLKLPEITDIELKTSTVMKAQGLGALHESIKSDSNYSPVDFNFSLNYLTVKNFRSISKYTLDFRTNYIITGHTGSGKSTLITALFYALVGNKSLKKEVKYGETDCRLQVSLDYQGVTYVLTRGTSKGDFGLTVGTEVKKFNSKLEFEKEVFEYLPFLSYHESFFFNYWDTELLGSMKVNRRYDLLAKYYRLDALSSYNDLAEAKLKVQKKILKECTEKVQTLTTIKDSKKLSYENILSKIQLIPSLEELTANLNSFKKYTEIKTQITEKELSLSKLKQKLDSLEISIQDKTKLIEALQINLGGSTLSEIDIETKLSNHSTASNLKARIDKGESLISKLDSDITVQQSQLDIYSSNLDELNLESGDEIIPIPEELIKSVSDLKQSIQEKKDILTSRGIELDYEKKSLQEKVIVLEKEISDLESKNNTSCSECLRPISNEDKLKTLQSKLTDLKALQEVNITSLQEFTNSRDLSLEELKTSDGALLVERENEIVKLTANNTAVKANLEKKAHIKSLIEGFKSNISSIENTKTTYSNGLIPLKADYVELDVLEPVEVANLTSVRGQIQMITKEEVILCDLKAKLNSTKEEDSEEATTLETRLNELKLSLSYYSDLSSEDYGSLITNINLHNQVEDLKVSYLDSSKLVDEKNAKLVNLQNKFNDITNYCELTSRSGVILKSILDELTKTFSSPSFKFITAKVQANGKVITDMSVSYLVGKRWIPYSSLSSGQRTLCDLYYISKIVTGVGIVSFDETLRFLDDENLKTAVSLIDTIKYNNLLISTHSSNLSMEGTTNLKCELKAGNTTDIELVI